MSHESANTVDAGAVRPLAVPKVPSRHGKEFRYAEEHLGWVPIRNGEIVMCGFFMVADLAGWWLAGSLGVSDAVNKHPEPVRWIIYLLVAISLGPQRLAKARHTRLYFDSGQLVSALDGEKSFYPLKAVKRALLYLGPEGEFQAIQLRFGPFRRFNVGGLDDMPRFVERLREQLPAGLVETRRGTRRYDVWLGLLACILIIFAEHFLTGPQVLMGLAAIFGLAFIAVKLRR